MILVGKLTLFIANQTLNFEIQKKLFVQAPV